MTRPEPGVVLGSCKIARVLDGDTIEVEVLRKVRVRILDCWAPEKKRTKHPSEKSRGLLSKHHAERCFPVGTGVILEIATDGDNDLGDGLTFGRVVGDVWADGDQRSFAEIMNATGYTFPTKAMLEASLDRSDKALERTT